MPCHFVKVSIITVAKSEIYTVAVKICAIVLVEDFMHVPYFCIKNFKVCKIIQKAKFYLPSKFLSIWCTLGAKFTIEMDHKCLAPLLLSSTHFN